MGMLMSAPVVVSCYETVRDMAESSKTRSIYMSPRGKVLDHRTALRLSSYDRLIILCGHYEGIDERAIDEVVDEEISIGDYVLTGGELAACVLCDCVGRLCSGVLADSECYERESIVCGLLEYPQYTRPEVFRGKRVPEVLLGGNHDKIERWRYEKSLEATLKKRPDLL